MAEKMEKKDFSIEESLKKIEAITAVLENPATSLKDGSLRRGRTACSGM